MAFVFYMIILAVLGLMLYGQFKGTLGTALSELSK